MRELLDCLKDWLDHNRADGNAYAALRALVVETLKRVDSPDPAQREFDAVELAVAAGGPSEFEAAKQWLRRAQPEQFAGARRVAIEEHFRAAGHGQALRPTLRSPSGRHRAVRYLERYPLPDEPLEEEPPDHATAAQAAAGYGAPAPSATTPTASIRYAVTPPGQVRAAWYARPLLGGGSFVTRSWRGLLWVGLLLLPSAWLIASALTMYSYTFARRALLASDVATLVWLALLAWTTWRIFLRPMAWLLEDRIVLGGDLWVGFKEEPAQLELLRDDKGQRRLQLVRYTAVCPVCAADVELRYATGANRRRLLGCCKEAPQEHVYSFDRVLHTGVRLFSGSQGGDG